MKISKLILLSISFILLGFTAFAQISYHDRKVIFKNGVKEIHTYEFKTENDSSLIATEKFNKFGRVTDIVSYNKSLGNRSCKIQYLKDTLNQTIEYFHQNKLTGIRRYKYNDIERKISYVESSNNDSDITTYTEKFNQNGHQYG